MERHRIKLSQEEFDKGKIPSNHIAVELLRLEKDAVTKGGIYAGFLEDVTWQEDGESHPADVASIIGRVVKLPDKLYYNEDDIHNSFPWDTDIDLEIGDLVWFNFIESLNTNEIQIDDKVLRFLPYQDCYACKRSPLIVFGGQIMRYPFPSEEDEVIMLNGYVLLEPIPLARLSELDHLSQEKVYTDRGIVAYVGKPNRAYVNKNYSDNPDIEEGQTAYLMPGYTPFLLERTSSLANFNGDKLYYCVQNRRIAFAV